MLSAKECLAKSRELEDWAAAAADAPAFRELAGHWRAVAALAAWQEIFIQLNEPMRLN